MGGRIEISATEARTNGPQLSLGREAASSGSLNIDGAGSVVSLSAASVLAGGGVGEAVKPLVKVGRDGSGQLNITAGGKLPLQGNAVSTAANARSTTLMIGCRRFAERGRNAHLPAGRWQPDGGRCFAGPRHGRTRPGLDDPGA